MVASSTAVTVADETLFDQVEPSLAESYWLAMTAEEADSITLEVQP